MIGTEPVELRALVERLDDLAARRLASRPRTDAARARARQLADLLRGHIRVRAASLDAPARRPAPWPDRRRQEHDLQHDRRPSRQSDRGPPTDDPGRGRPRPSGRSGGPRRGRVRRGAAGQLRFVEDGSLERGPGCRRRPGHRLDRACEPGARGPSRRGRGPVLLRDHRHALRGPGAMGGPVARRGARSAPPRRREPDAARSRRPGRHPRRHPPAARGCRPGRPPGRRARADRRAS